MIQIQVVNYLINARRLTLYKKVVVTIQLTTFILIIYYVVTAVNKQNQAKKENHNLQVNLI